MSNITKHAEGLARTCTRRIIRQTVTWIGAVHAIMRLKDEVRIFAQFYLLACCLTCRQVRRLAVSISPDNHSLTGHSQTIEHMHLRG